MGKNVLVISLVAAALYTIGHYGAHMVGKGLSFSADQNVLFVTGVVFVSTMLGTWLVLKIK